MATPSRSLSIVAGIGAAIAAAGCSGSSDQTAPRASVGTRPSERHAATSRAQDSRAAKPPRRRWARFPRERFEPELAELQTQQIEQLEAIGYVGESDVPGAGLPTIARYDPARALPGRKVFVSGDGPCAFLAEMESAKGRAFEITTSGEVVWDFYNPHRSGEESRYIAVVPELIRLPPPFGDEWLDE